MVISQQQAYLQALKNLGVKGFRIDAAKHMPNSHMNAVLTSTIKSGVHVFGENITGGGAGDLEHDRFLAPYLSGTDHGAYDFPLLAWPVPHRLSPRQPGHRRHQQVRQHGERQRQHEQQRAVVEHELHRHHRLGQRGAHCERQLQLQPAGALRAYVVALRGSVIWLVHTQLHVQ